MGIDICAGCNKDIKVPRLFIPCFITVMKGQKPDPEKAPVCGKCWRIFWQELKTYNPWLEGGMPF